MLEVRNLTKSFSAAPGEHPALNHVNLTVEKGEFICIIGSNGAGKSTLFSAICGTFWPDGGTVLLDGEDITYLPEYKRASKIGRLFQDPMRGTAPNMTVEENLVLSYSRSKHNGLRRAVCKEDRQFFKQALAEFGMGLEDRLDAKVGTLSGGQRQALTLLMSTIVPPKLLLLDEHTAALDPAAAEKILSITRKIVQKHTLTTLMITHNVQSALSCGSRTVMMDEGKIILDLSGETRQQMTVSGLLELYFAKQKKRLDNDRMLFS